MEETKSEPAKVEKASSSDVEKNKTMAVLAYFIFFLPLLAAKDSKFAMYHANQSLILVIAWVASSVIAAIIPAVGSVISAVLGLVLFVFWIMGIIAAAQGEMKPIPYIGQYTLIK